MKAVNQSIGRAVRHKNDYSTVLLLDSRYSRDKIQSALPQWMKPSLITCEKFGPAFSSLTKVITHPQEPFPDYFKIRKGSISSCAVLQIEKYISMKLSTLVLEMGIDRVWSLRKKQRVSSFITIPKRKYCSTTFQRTIGKIINFITKIKGNMLLNTIIYL